jgi:hypothetical protein
VITKDFENTAFVSMVKVSPAWEMTEEKGQTE